MQVNDLIKITNDFQFGFGDLMRTIDPNHKFTLRNVLRACMGSSIPLSILQEIIDCPYLEEYWEEINSKDFSDDGDIEYLELAWASEINEYDGEIDSGHVWHFNGVGCEGVIPEDLLNNSTEQEIEKMREEKYRQGFAIEFTPLHELADYEIRIENKISIQDWREWDKVKNAEVYDDSSMFTVLDVQPSITLIELLYWIFWELSFMGSPERRDEEIEILAERCKELDVARKNGTLDKITIPWEDVKDKLKKKYLKEDD